MSFDQRRLWERVDRSAGFFACWPWTAGRSGSGYGSVSFNGRNRDTHRVVYELLVGPVPAGLQIDHLCRNRACVNPAHMQVVTRRENILRGTSPSAVHARKTRCPRGHPYDTIQQGKQRRCGACRRERYAERVAS